MIKRFIKSLLYSDMDMNLVDAIYKGVHCIVRLYLKLRLCLIFLFTCAGYVSLRDEMFCSFYSKRRNTHEIIYAMDFAKSEDGKQQVTDRLFSLRSFLRNAIAKLNRETFLSLYNIYANMLRMLTPVTNELPEKHRVRLRFCSD